MRLLLDTNAMLWAFSGSPRIKPVAELLLADDTNVFVSAVSFWEAAIKIRIGKLNSDVLELRRAAQISGFLELPLLAAHAEVLATLPRHHNDPFDHMLLAQAISEPMRLVTGDRALSAYTSLVMQI
ncbi:MAG: type II toxin-antitoxin system VapC family toxin [Methylobacteriaceae bacterium]|jgi:PIN domain nuclease of toxin-antitoxin system|nr:type II toxin-antitoxin system VapC family toxin [Methylobacteriaceae bacterium]